MVKGTREIEPVLNHYFQKKSLPMMTTLMSVWSTILNLYDKGGIIMIPLGICSLLMVMVILERMWVLRNFNIFPVQELKALRDYSEKYPDNLHTMQPKTTYPLGRILSCGLAVFPHSAERFKEAIQDQARRELHYVERGLVLLEIIVGVAPLLGLLGTGLGLIKVFEQISIVGARRAEALSQGISEALLTTVIGLSIGIPALIAFNLFTRRIETIKIEIEQEILFFYHKLYPER